MSEVSFRAVGVPACAGSKRAFAFRRAGGKLGVSVTDDNKRNRPWHSVVHLMALEAMAGRPLLDGPLRLVCTFVFQRPKGHHGAKGIKPAAPRRHAQKPDLDKLTRLVMDACTGAVWTDDARVWEHSLSKRWCEPGEPPGVYVIVQSAP